MVGDARSDGWGRLYQREFDTVAPSVPAAACVVYCALVSCRSATTTRTPPLGIALLMRKTGQPRRTIFRNLAILEEAGFITRASAGKRLVFGFPMLMVPSAAPKQCHQWHPEHNRTEGAGAPTPAPTT